MVLLPLKEPNLFKSLGITPPRGVLFHGPPGTGKTLVARQLARACSAHLVKNRPHDDRAEAKRSGVAFFVRNGADCLSKYVGEAEKALGSLFDEAKAKAPSIIFFDELDGLAPARAAGRGGSGELAQHSVVATLLALMDGLADRGDVVVIGATNRPDALDPALRRPGRFDRELQFCAPDETQRRAILALHTESWAPSSKPTPQLLSALAARTAGFCGADLRALCTEAALAAVRRARPDLYENTPGSRTAVVVSARDFEAAARRRRRRQLRRMRPGRRRARRRRWRTPGAAVPGVRGRGPAGAGRAAAARRRGADGGVGGLRPPRYRRAARARKAWPPSRRRRPSFWRPRTARGRGTSSSRRSRTRSRRGGPASRSVATRRSCGTPRAPVCPWTRASRRARGTRGGRRRRTPTRSSSSRTSTGGRRARRTRSTSRSPPSSTNYAGTSGSSSSRPRPTRPRRGRRGSRTRRWWSCRPRRRRRGPRSGRRVSWT